MTALLPCPFCGASPHRKLGRVWQERHHGETHQEIIIECPHLCAKMTGTSDAALVARWNRRAAPLPTREEVADAILANFHDACMEAPRCTQPGCKCAMDAADAVLRLLGANT